MAKGKKRLTKKEKLTIQKTLRSDPAARSKYANIVADVVRRNLEYVRQEAKKEGSNDYSWEKSQELSEFIVKWPNQVCRELQAVLDLAAGEDIKIKKKKKPDRFELMNLE